MWVLHFTAGRYEACVDYLDWLPWPNGPVCPACGHGAASALVSGRAQRCGAHEAGPPHPRRRSSRTSLFEVNISGSGRGLAHSLVWYRRPREYARPAVLSWTTS
jgi:hypothetical protein